MARSERPVGVGARLKFKANRTHGLPRQQLVATSLD